MMWRELSRICSGGGGQRTTQTSISEPDSGPSTVDGEHEDDDKAQAEDGDGDEPSDDERGNEEEEIESLHTTAAATTKSVPSNRSMISLSF